MSEEREWHKGFPKLPGVYLCRVDHEAETFFNNHYCDLNKRCRWMTLTGKDVVNHYVEWTGGRVGIDEMDVERARWPR